MWCLEKKSARTYIPTNVFVCVPHRNKRNLTGVVNRTKQNQKPSKENQMVQIRVQMTDGLLQLYQYNENEQMLLFN